MSNFLSRGLKKVGGLAKKAAPFAAFVPGIGPALATGLAVGGSALDHGGAVNEHMPTAVGGMAGAASMAELDGAGTPDAGGWMGGLKKVGGLLGQHGDQLLGAASLGEGYLNQRKSNNLSNEALNVARQSYADRAGLRKLGVSQMMDQTAPDLSAAFQSSNPYSKLRKVG